MIRKREIKRKRGTEKRREEIMKGCRGAIGKIKE